MEERKLADNEILVGGKAVLAYAYTVNYLFNEKKLKEIKLKARGKMIQKAVSLAEFVKKVNKEAKVSNIEIGSDKTQNKEKKDVFVSFIEITLSK